MSFKRYLLVFVAVIAVMAVSALTVAAQDETGESSLPIVEDNTDLFRFVIGGCSAFDAANGNDISSAAPLTPGEQHRVISYSGTQTTVGGSSVIQIEWVRIRTSEITSVWVPGSCGTLIFAG